METFSMSTGAKPDFSAAFASINRVKKAKNPKKTASRVLDGKRCHW
jgi:hypothetical protein